MLTKMYITGPGYIDSPPTQTIWLEMKFHKNTEHKDNPWVMTDCQIPPSNYWVYPFIISAVSGPDSK